MFGLGFGEILLILAVALVVVGPKKLPEVARLVARGLAEFRRHADEVQRTIQKEIHEPLKASDLQRSASGPVQVQPGPPPGEKTVTGEAEKNPSSSGDPAV